MQAGKGRMKTRKKSRIIVFAAAMAASALLAAAYPGLKAHILNGGTATPPGVGLPQRQLITVWLYGDLSGAAGWLRQQAAAYGRKHPGVSVWLRTVSGQDVEQMAEAPPDVLVFTADQEVPAGEATALCMSGYALLSPARESVTAVPRSLFGLPPTPDPAAAPPEALPWPAAFAADDGFGVLALGAMGAPEGGTLCKASEIRGRFENGEAALLTVAQAQTEAAKELGYQVIAAAPATDLVLYGMACTERSDGAGLLKYLAGEEAQRALADRGLISAMAGLRLYGADRPMLQALEAALADGWHAPAFSWPRERRELILTGQALYAAGEKMEGLLQ